MAGYRQLLPALCTLCTCLLVGVLSAPSGGARALAASEMVAQHCAEEHEAPVERATISAPEPLPEARRRAAYHVARTTPQRPCGHVSHRPSVPIFTLHCALLI
jgi:hypothetical protein